MATAFSHPFRKLAEAYKKLRRELPMKVSAIAEAEFKENFTRQGYRDASGVVKWRKRKNDKDQGRAILIKRGRLRRSFKKRPSDGVARVINDAPYAKALNEGSTESVRVKGHTRRRMEHVKVGTGVYSIKSRKQRTRTEKRAGAKFRVKGYRRKNNLAARPFMVTTKPLMEDIDKKVTSEVSKIFDSIKQ